MMILKDILYKVPLNAVAGSTNISIQNIDFDSRKIAKNDVFVAIKGSLSDGHNFVEKAIEKANKIGG